MRLRITQHAVDRLIQRADFDLSKNKAFSIIMNTVQPQRHKIKEGLNILNDVRVQLNENLVAICITDKRLQNTITVVTIRRIKDGH